MPDPVSQPRELLLCSLDVHAVREVLGQLKPFNTINLYKLLERQGAATADLDDPYLHLLLDLEVRKRLGRALTNPSGRPVLLAHPLLNQEFLVNLRRWLVQEELPAPYLVLVDPTSAHVELGEACDRVITTTGQWVLRA